MTLHVKKMEERKAVEILGWRYEAPYNFYHNEDSAEDRAELLNGSYHALEDEDGRLAGFYCTGTSAQVPAGHESGMYMEEAVDMGLGMHPELTGKGGGLSFCLFILEQINRQYPGLPVRLTVAAFNKRAIHLYEKLGFLKTAEFSTNNTDFYVMVKNSES